MKYAYLHPRDELALTLSRIYRYKMTTTSGGNLSILDENGDMWITPSRIDKGTLKPTDIVCVKKDGTIVGLHSPSSEYPFHRAIYAARPDIKAIVHAHPVSIVAFSISKKTPDTKLIPQTYHWNGQVAFAPYGIPGSEDLGKKIAQKFTDGYNSVILESHGVCCGASTFRTPSSGSRPLSSAARPKSSPASSAIRSSSPKSSSSLRAAPKRIFPLSSTTSP